jgi:hypothetical protein
LGDIVANAAIAPMFRRRGIDLELVDHDLKPPSQCFLDERIGEINSSFDMVMIGPGGFLGPKLIGSVFRDCESWSRLTVPLCFNGIGDRPRLPRASSAGRVGGGATLSTSPLLLPG